jgi:hypothetical protein
VQKPLKKKKKKNIFDIKIASPSMALGSLKNNGRIPGRTQRNFQATLNLRPESAEVHLSKLYYLELAERLLSELEPDPEIELHINGVNPSKLLRIELRELISPQQNQLLPHKHGVQKARILVPLVKRRQSIRTEPLVLVLRGGLDGVVVDSELLVGVSDWHVEGKVVVESSVFAGGEIQLRERRLCDVELDVSGAEDEPKDEENKANLQKAAEAFAAFPARLATVRGCRGPEVDAVLVWLFLCHR